MSSKPRGPAQPRRKPSRSQVASRSARVAVRKSVIRIIVSAALLAGLHWGIPYLRRWPGLSAGTHSTISALLAISHAGVAIFLVAELCLLAGAVLTVRCPELHRRFVNLMFYWSYALVAPYMIIKSWRMLQPLPLPDPAAPGEAEPSAGTEPARLLSPAGAQRRRPSSGPVANHATHADRPVPVTRDEYRKALRLLLQHTKLLQDDSALLGLLLEQATEPGMDVTAAGNGLGPAEVPGTGAPAAQRLPAGGFRAKVRREEYRKALQLLLEHTQVLQQNRKLLDLLLTQLAKPEYDEHIAELAQVSARAGSRPGGRPGVTAR